MMRRLIRLARDRAGTAAIEFAVVAPLALAMFFGVYELSSALVVYMKLSSAAETVADLAAQTPPGTSLHAGDIDDLYTAAQLIMTPSAPAGLGLAVASVTFSGGTAAVAWQQTRGGATPMTDAATSAATFGLGANGESVVVARLTYSFTSPLRYVLPQAIALSERAFARPRQASSIPYS